jgi:iron complex transport system substrate-binding protein
MRHNLPAVVIIILSLGMALGLELVQAETGRFEIYERYRKYGGPDFDTGATQYPRVADDSEGYVLKLYRPVQTIASQYWSIDEYVYSIAQPRDVVAVSQSAYDRSYSNVFKWAEMFQPAVATDPEVILKLNPDLLLVSSDARADFTQLLRAVGLPIFRTYTSFTTLDEVRRTIRLMGYLTGNDDKAVEVEADFEDAIQRARRRKPAASAAPRILGYSGGYSYGDQTLFDDIVRTLGGINVGAENGLHSYSPLNTEQIVRWDPEWIISSAPRGQAESVLRRLMNDPAIAPTAAARNRQVVVLDNNVFLPMSPFTALMLDALGDALYP